MFPLFKPKLASKSSRKTWLDNNELSELQALAEQIDSLTNDIEPLNTQQSGHLASHSMGSGTDYAESRVYQAGDDPRSINWRLSARSHETFIKTYHTESRPCLSILLDQRKSMIFGTKKRLKIVQALRVASLLAYASKLHQLNFQAWILNDSSLRSFSDSDEFLLQANLINQQNSAPTKNIDSALQEILVQLSQNTLFYLVSDLVDIKRKDHLSDLSERCFVQAIHIQDQAEINIPNVGELYLQDLQATYFVKVNTQKTKECLNFSTVAHRTINKRKALITNLNIAYCPLLTNEENIQTSISLPLRNI